MPFYTCIHPQVLLTAKQKEALAQGITDVHCKLTGAPQHFVHVLFQAYAPGDCFTGGAPSRVVNIRGAVRQGRSQDVKEKLLMRITVLWREQCSATAMPDIVVSLTENPGSNVMEGGVLLPHPKDDADWMSRNGFTGVAPQAVE